jgi:hypothetical protein
LCHSFQYVSPQHPPQGQQLHSALTMCPQPLQNPQCFKQHWWQQQLLHPEPQPHDCSQQLPQPQPHDCSQPFPQPQLLQHPPSQPVHGQIGT